MFSYDKKNDILTISKIPVMEINEEEYRESEMYKSYISYVEGPMLDDIRKLLVEEGINQKMVDMDKAAHQVEVVAGKGNFFVTTESKEYLPDYRERVVYARLKPKYQGLSEYTTNLFPILVLPDMDKTGILYNKGKKQAVIGMLAQADDITFDVSANKDQTRYIKIITEEGYNITVVVGGKSIVAKVGTEKISVLQLLAALATREGRSDVNELIECMSRIPLIRNIYGKSIGKEVDVAKQLGYIIVRDNRPEIFKNIDAPQYSIRKVRPKMQEVFSLDRAVGRRLSEDVVIGERVLLKRDTILTAKDIELLKENDVFKIYVSYVPARTGTYLAEQVNIFALKRGTEIIPELQEFMSDSEVTDIYHPIPHQKGQYITKDISLAHMLILPQGMGINSNLLSVLEYNGVESVKVTNTHGAWSNAEEIFFSAPVVTNTSVSNKYIAESSTFMSLDLLALVTLLDRLYVGEDLGVIASKDFGLRKRVDMVGDIFRKCLKNATKEFVRTNGAKVCRKISESGVQVLNEGELERLFFPLSKEFRTKLRESKSTQPVDFTNPLAFYSSLDKINTFTKSKHSIADSMRTMTMGHYGRLCPYEMPSGAKLGVVNTRAMFCRVDDGIMKTPYRKVNKVEGRLEEEWTYLSIAEEEKFRIADCTDVVVNDAGYILTTGKVLARIPSSNTLEKMDIGYVDIKNVDYVSVDPQQTLSQATSIIPFIGSDDAARVTYEISMSKQAKALQEPDIPYVMTSAYKNVLKKSDYYLVTARSNGVVTEVYNDSVRVKYDDAVEEEAYYYKQTEIVTHSVITRRPEVFVGQRVEKGDVLITSNYVRDGFLAMGVNAITCYIPEGYNYEDGIYVSERLGEKLTSFAVHSEEEKVPAKKKDCIPRPTNKKIYYNAGEKIYSRVMSGNVQDSVYSKKAHGFVLDVLSNRDGFTGRVLSTAARTLSLDRMGNGDKMANRHGNKGVCPPARKNIEMPRFLNGEFFDVVYNPAGVSSRMNIGQIKECHLGLTALVLRTRYISDPFNGASEQDIALLLEVAYRLANEEDAKKVLSDYPQLPDEWKQKRLENIDWIRSWKGCFNQDGTAWLYNPRTGKVFERPVLVGINYVHKLVQEAAAKVHVRGGYVDSRYKMKTGAPTEGASNEGGQRMGEMELAALAAYGAAEYLYELENPRGDNPIARCDLFAEMLCNPQDVNTSRGIRRSLEEFIYKAEALGCVVEFTGDELPNYNMRAGENESRERRVWSPKAMVGGECFYDSALSREEFDKVVDDFASDF